MLIKKHDAALDDEEWREFLKAHDFGELIAPGTDRDLPVVVPAHFLYDGDRTVLLHLARINPVWDAIAERPRALLSVFGAPAYVPGHWNQDEYGVPTSYHAAVQLACDVATVDDPSELAALLERQLGHFQHGPARPGRARREPRQQAAPVDTRDAAHRRPTSVRSSSSAATGLHSTARSSREARGAWEGLDREARAHTLRQLARQTAGVPRNEG